MAVDSIFMMPHLGVLSQLYPDIALEVLFRDCLIVLGTAVVPVGNKANFGDEILEVSLAGQRPFTLRFGEVKHVELPPGQTIAAELNPSRRFDVGAGPGKSLHVELTGGPAGLFFDGRGRPLRLPAEPAKRRELLRQWYVELKTYDADELPS